jgi:hypothetical protein
MNAARLNKAGGRTEFRTEREGGRTSGSAALVFLLLRMEWIAAHRCALE